MTIIKYALLNVNKNELRRDLTADQVLIALHKKGAYTAYVEPIEDAARHEPIFRVRSK